MKKESKRNIVAFKIRGTASLIQNAFAQKTVLQMLARHMNLTVDREPKVPRRILENAVVRNIDGAVVIPATAIKRAMISASSLVKSFDRKKKILQISFHVMGQSLPLSWQIPGMEPNQGYIPRMDICRTSGVTRAPDVRFRPEFPDWSCKLAIEYSPDVLSPDALADLLDRAGNVGLCEWRPEKSGSHGTFELEDVLDASEIDDVVQACSRPIKSTEIPDWALDAELNLDPETLARMFDGSKAGAEEGLKKLKGSHCDGNSVNDQDDDADDAEEAAS